MSGRQKSNQSSNRGRPAGSRNTGRSTNTRKTNQGGGNQGGRKKGNQNQNQNSPTSMLSINIPSGASIVLNPQTRNVNTRVSQSRSPTQVSGSSNTRNTTTASRRSFSTSSRDTKDQYDPSAPHNWGNTVRKTAATAMDTVADKIKETANQLGPMGATPHDVNANRASERSSQNQRSSPFHESQLQQAANKAQKTYQDFGTNNSPSQMRQTDQHKRQQQQQQQSRQSSPFIVSPSGNVTPTFEQHEQKPNPTFDNIKRAFATMASKQNQSGSSSPSSSRQGRSSNQQGGQDYRTEIKRDNFGRVILPSTTANPGMLKEFGRAQQSAQQQQGQQQGQQQEFGRKQSGQQQQADSHTTSGSYQQDSDVAQGSQTSSRTRNQQDNVQGSRLSQQSQQVGGSSQGAAGNPAGFDKGAPQFTTGEHGSLTGRRTFSTKPFNHPTSPTSDTIKNIDDHLQRHETPRSGNNKPQSTSTSQSDRRNQGQNKDQRSSTTSTDRGNKPSGSQRSFTDFARKAHGLSDSQGHEGVSSSQAGRSTNINRGQFDTGPTKHSGQPEFGQTTTTSSGQDQQSSRQQNRQQNQQQNNPDSRTQKTSGQSSSSSQTSRSSSNQSNQSKQSRSFSTDAHNEHARAGGTAGAGGRGTYDTEANQAQRIQQQHDTGNIHRPQASQKHPEQQPQSTSGTTTSSRSPQQQHGGVHDTQKRSTSRHSSPNTPFQDTSDVGVKQKFNTMYMDNIDGDNNKVAETLSTDKNATAEMLRTASIVSDSVQHSNTSPRAYRKDTDTTSPGRHVQEATDPSRTADSSGGRGSDAQGNAAKKNQPPVQSPFDSGTRRSFSSIMRGGEHDPSGQQGRTGQKGRDDDWTTSSDDDGSRPTSSSKSARHRNVDEEELKKLHSDMYKSANEYNRTHKENIGQSSQDPSISSQSTFGRNPNQQQQQQNRNKTSSTERRSVNKMSSTNSNFDEHSYDKL